MQSLLATIPIAFTMFACGTPFSYAGQVRDAKVIVEEQADSVRKDSLDGVLISFGLGSILSSGSAQQAVNQEGHREEAAKQEKVRKSASEESTSKTSGEGAKGSTASGAGESRPTARRAPENW